jgi:hypothetical protein
MCRPYETAGRVHALRGIVADARQITFMPTLAIDQWLLVGDLYADPLAA